MLAASTEAGASAQECTASASSSACDASDFSCGSVQVSSSHAGKTRSAASSAAAAYHMPATRCRKPLQASQVGHALGLLGSELQATATGLNSAAPDGTGGERHESLGAEQLNTERCIEAPPAESAAKPFENAMQPSARVEAYEVEEASGTSALAQLPRKGNPGGSALRRADDTQWTCSFPGCQRLFKHKDSVRRHCGLAHPAWFLELEENRIHHSRNDDASYFYACLTAPASCAPSAARDEVVSAPKTRSSKHSSSALATASDNNHGGGLGRCASKHTTAVKQEDAGTSLPACACSPLEHSGAETRSSRGKRRRTDEGEQRGGEPDSVTLKLPGGSEGDRSRGLGETEGVTNESPGRVHQPKEKKRRRGLRGRRSNPSDSAASQHSRGSRGTRAEAVGESAGLRDEMSAGLDDEQPGESAVVNAGGLGESAGVHDEGAVKSSGVLTAGLGEAPGSHARVPGLSEDGHDESSTSVQDIHGCAGSDGAREGGSAASERVGCEGVRVASFAQSEQGVPVEGFAACAVACHAAGPATSKSDGGEGTSALEGVCDQPVAAAGRVRGDGAAAGAGSAASDAARGEGVVAVEGGRGECWAAFENSPTLGLAAPEGALVDGLATSEGVPDRGAATVEGVSGECSAASQRVPEQGAAASAGIGGVSSAGTGSARGQSFAASEEVRGEGSAAFEELRGECLAVSEEAPGKGSAGCERVRGESSAAPETVRVEGAAATEDACSDGPVSSDGYHGEARETSRGVDPDAMCHAGPAACEGGGDECSGSSKESGPEGAAAAEIVHDVRTAACESALRVRSVSSEGARDESLAASADSPVERLPTSEGALDESWAPRLGFPEDCSTAVHRVRDEGSAESHPVPDERSATAEGDRDQRSTTSHGVPTEGTAAAAGVPERGSSTSDGVPNEGSGAAESVDDVRSAASDVSRRLGSGASEGVCDGGSDGADRPRGERAPRVVLDRESAASEAIRLESSTAFGDVRIQAMAGCIQAGREGSQATRGVSYDGPAQSDDPPDQCSAPSDGAQCGGCAWCSRVLGQGAAASVGARAEAFSDSEDNREAGAAASDGFRQQSAVDLNFDHKEGRTASAEDHEATRGDGSAASDRVPACSAAAAELQWRESSADSSCVRDDCSAASDDGRDVSAAESQGFRDKSAAPSEGIRDARPAAPGGVRDASSAASACLRDEDLAASVGVRSASPPGSDGVRDVIQAAAERLREAGQAISDGAQDQGSAASEPDRGGGSATSEDLSPTDSPAFKVLDWTGSAVHDGAHRETWARADGLHAARVAALDTVPAGGFAGYDGSLMDGPAGYGCVASEGSAGCDGDRVQATAMSDSFGDEDAAASEGDGGDSSVVSERVCAPCWEGDDESNGEESKTPRVRWNRNRNAHDVVLPNGTWWNEVHIGWFVEAWWQHLASASTAEFNHLLQQLSAWAVEGHGIDCLAAWLSRTYSLRQDLTTIRILELLNYIRWQPSAALRRLLEEVYLLLTHEENAISETARSVVMRMEAQLRSHSWAQPWTDEDSSCFCGTERHLPSNGLPFAGTWVQCQECERWCHAECTNLAQNEAELMPAYSCPDCTNRAGVGAASPTTNQPDMSAGDAAACASTLQDFASDTEAPSSCSSTKNSPVRVPHSSPVGARSPTGSEF